MTSETFLPRIFDQAELDPRTDAVRPSWFDRGYILSSLPFALPDDGLIIQRNCETGFRRFIAIAWPLRPALLRYGEGKRMCLADLAALPEINCGSKYFPASALSQFSEKWGFHSMTQKRPGIIENFAEGARLGWEKRRGTRSTSTTATTAMATMRRSCRQCSHRSPHRAARLRGLLRERAARASRSAGAARRDARRTRRSADRARDGASRCRCRRGAGAGAARGCGDRGARTAAEPSSAS